MLYELRHYTVKKGKMKAWVKLFEEQILPFQVSKGMVITGSYTAEKDPTTFIWMRRFKNEADRKRLYTKVYETHEWKDILAPQVDKVLDVKTIKVTRLVPTTRSVAQ
jgi:hypothetical protein